MSCADGKIDICLVLDKSPSVVLSSIIASAASTIDLIAAENAFDGLDRRVAVVTFSDIHSDGFGDWTGPHAELLSTFTSDLAALQVLVEGITVGNGSDVAAALTLAQSTIEADAQAGAQCAVVLISDGQWNVGVPGEVDPVPVASDMLAAHPDWALYGIDTTSSGEHTATMADIGALGSGYYFETTPAGILSAVVASTDPCDYRIGASQAGASDGRIYRNGKLLAFAMAGTMEWTHERYGGFQDFTLNLNATFAEGADIAPGDRIEFWWKGERRYRGYVYGTARDQADPQKLSVTGFGISYHAGKPIATHPYAYPVPADLSRAFADIATEFVTPVLPTLRISAEIVGATVSRVEATYKSFRDVMNDLCANQGENRALWGGDVRLVDSADQLFIRPFDTAVRWSVAVPGALAGAGRSEAQAGDIVNRLLILGGNQKFPNLIYNPSFERPRYGGEGSGNLLEEGGFEPEGAETQTDSSGFHAPWGGSGTYKSGSGTGEGAPYEGSWMAETDNNNETVNQTQNPPSTAVVPDHDYVISAWAHCENEAEPTVGTLTLTWLATGGGTLGTAVIDLPAPTSASDPKLLASWQQWTKTLRAPADATGLKVEGKVVSGGGVGKGILWDLMEVYAADQTFQDGWELSTSGTSAANTVNWTYTDPQGAFDGGYCVYVDITASDADANEARLQAIGQRKFEIQGGAVYTASVRLKSPTGVTSNGKMQLVVREYDQQGHEVGSATRHDIAAGGGFADWTLQNVNRAFAQTSTHAVYYLAFRGNSQVEIDGMCFRDSAAGTDMVGDGQFIVQIAVDDGRLTGLSAEAASSITDNGIWDDQVSVDTIISIADALTYASDYFNVHAVAYAQPTIDLHGDDRFFQPGHLLRLIGPDGRVMMTGPTGQQDSLPIVRARWRWDGILHVTLELQKEQPDLASLLVKKLQRQIGTTSASTSNSSSSAGSGGSGGSTDTSDFVLVDGSRAFTADQSMGANRLTNVEDPSGNQDAATKAYIANNALLSANSLSELSGTAATARSNIGAAAASDLTDHIDDTTDAHNASAVSFDPTGLDNISETDVQAALGEVDTAVSTALAGIAALRAITFAFDGGTTAVANGSYSTVAEVPVACVILSARIFAEVSDSAVVDILRAAYSGYPTMASICSTTKPTLASQPKNEDTTLSGWTDAHSVGSPSLNAGDLLRAHVVSVGTPKQITVVLTVQPVA